MPGSRNFTSDPQWPTKLLILRHGQSAGNVARDLAEKNRLSTIDIAIRDMDVPLSPLGETQARAVGRWLRDLPPLERPTVVIVSPYERAKVTGRLALDEMGDSDPKIAILQDERLREREFGIVDRLTKLGIQEKYPEQAEFHARLKKFYYRPPGGESWCDVILRLRSFQDSLARDHAGERVLVICHSVVVLCFRYLLERMTEDRILAIDRENEIANCSVTAYRWNAEEPRRDPVLELFNFVAPVEESGAQVTRKPDVPGPAS